MTKPEWQELLREHVLEFTFTKVDGTERKMKATLKASFLPPIEDVKAETDLGPENVVRCWDVDKAAWRSFRTDTVTKGPQLLQE